MADNTCGHSLALSAPVAGTGARLYLRWVLTAVERAIGATAVNTFLVTVPQQKYEYQHLCVRLLSADATTKLPIPTKLVHSTSSCRCHDNYQPQHLHIRLHACTSETAVSTSKSPCPTSVSPHLPLTRFLHVRVCEKMSKSVTEHSSP